MGNGYRYSKEVTVVDHTYRLVYGQYGFCLQSKYVRDKDIEDNWVDVDVCDKYSFAEACRQILCVHLEDN